MSGQQRGVSALSVEQIEAASERFLYGDGEMDGSTFEAIRDLALSSLRTNDERDRDWILAMAAALGTDSGYKVPIVPKPEPFRELFDSLRASAAGEKDVLGYDSMKAALIEDLRRSRLNASRYEWLRDRPLDINFWTPDNQLICAEQLDAAIDAALANEKGK